MTGIPAMPGRRNLKPAWWAPDGFAVVPTAALDPPRRAPSSAVPALHGSGSPWISISQRCGKSFPKEGKCFPALFKMKRGAVAGDDGWLGHSSRHVEAPGKQRHTAKRVFDRLRAGHGFTGGYTIVKDYVRERERRKLEMFVLLARHTFALVSAEMQKLLKGTSRARRRTRITGGS
jgi:hypothetical protein